MTFEQLLTIKSIVDERISDCRQNIQTIQEGWEACKDQYIRESLPFPFKERQRVTVTLRVTGETLSRIRYRAGCAPRLGDTYSKTGIVSRYIIGDRGELRPNFWGLDGYYSPTDEVVSIELAEQSQERCGSCRYFRDGGCFMSGGTKPVWETALDSYICGWYDGRRCEE